MGLGQLILFIIGIGPFLLAAAEPKVIYGDDDRQELSQESSGRFHSMARAIAAQVADYELSDQGEFFRFLNPMTLERSQGICPDVAFAQQPVIASCTAFLIAPDMIATAGHCVGDEKRRPCSRLSWIFDVQNFAHKTFDPGHIPKENVFRCQEIIERSYNSQDYRTPDYAIIRLDRPALGRTPLILNHDSKSKEGGKVFSFGFPMGVPLKFIGNGTILSQALWPLIGHNIDSFTMQSGSPVIDHQSGQVLGIMGHGKMDLYGDPSQCYRENVCDEDGKNCKYEKDHGAYDLPMEYSTSVSVFSSSSKEKLGEAGPL